MFLKVETLKFPLPGTIRRCELDQNGEKAEGGELNLAISQKTGFFTE
jgi:hypothetical protein